MTAHRPDIRTTQSRVTGRWVAGCLTCKETSPASTHKPLVDAWKRDHIKAAQTIVRKAGAR